MPFQYWPQFTSLMNFSPEIFHVFHLVEGAMFGNELTKTIEKYTIIINSILSPLIGHFVIGWIVIHQLMVFFGENFRNTLSNIGRIAIHQL